MDRSVEPRSTGTSCASRALAGKPAESRDPPERLRVLDELVAGPSLMPHELAGLLLPRDLSAFDDHLEERTREVAELLDEGRALVEAVERLVCGLYALPADLEEAVLAHAAHRAEKRGLPAE